MNRSDDFASVIAVESIRIRGMRWLRTLTVVGFVATIGVFFTAPVSQHSAYDKPLPMPDEIESILVP